MKKSELFDITLKIFGIYFLVITLEDLKMFFTFYLSGAFNNMGRNFSWAGASLPYVLMFTIDVFFLWLFLFRTKHIAKFVLPQENESEIKWTLDKHVVLQIAVIVVGGLMLTDSITSIGRRIISIYQAAQLNIEIQSNDIPFVIWECLSAIIGFALISASSAIASKLIPPRKIKAEQ